MPSPAEHAPPARAAAPMGPRRGGVATRLAVAMFAGAAVVNPAVLAHVAGREGAINVAWVTLLLWGLTAALLVAGLLLSVSARAARWAAAYWIRVALLVGSAALAVVVLELSLGLYAWLARPRHVKVQNFEFAFDVSLNSDFFRDAEFHREKPADEIRVFLIGDSQVFGMGVPQDQTIPHLLETRLRHATASNYRVFNLGVPGVSPAEYARVAERFAAYSPDLVLVAIYVDNDFMDPESIVQWLKRREVYRILDLSLNRFLEGCPYPWVRRYHAEPLYTEAACRGEITPFLLTRAAVPDNQAYYDRLAQVFDAEPHVKDSLLRIRDVSRGARFVVVVLPSKYQVDAAYFPELRKLGFTLPDTGVLDDVIQRRMRTWAASAGIELLDLLPAIRDADARPGAALYHAIDDHLNTAGNEVVSGVLSRWIATAGDASR